MTGGPWQGACPDSAGMEARLDWTFSATGSGRVFCCSGARTGTTDNNQGGKVNRDGLLLMVCVVLIPSVVQAQVYRCLAEDGAPVFSDEPCGDGAERISVDRPMSVPSLSPSERRQFNRDRQRRDAERTTRLRQRQAEGREAQDRAQQAREAANWHRQQASRGNVVRGMTPGLVRHAWGEPNEIRHSGRSGARTEHWIYHRRRGRSGRAQVDFRDGYVSQVHEFSGSTRYRSLSR